MLCRDINPSDSQKQIYHIIIQLYFNSKNFHPTSTQGGINTKSVKSKNIIVFQIIAIIFLLLGIAGRILQNQDYDLLLFGRPLIVPIYMTGFLLFYLAEILVVLLLYIKTEKKLIFLTYIVLIPLILFHMYVWLISSSSHVSTKKNTYPEFNTTIIIENGYDLFGDYSRIYETKNNILLKYVAVIDGDPYPLGNDSSYDVKIEKNRIIYTYEDNFSETNKRQLILQYENGHFKEVTN